MRQNRFIGIVWGGITGMLLFSGIYIGSIIATAYVGNLLPASGPSIQKFFCMNKWTFEGVQIAFIIAASLGVISGVIAGWRCPQASQKLFVPAAVIGIPAILIGWFLYTYAIRVSVPHSIKLSDCTNGTINIHLKVPEGHSYYLELAMPDVQREPNGASVSSYKFSGGIRISNEISLVAEFPISSEKAFLDPSGFILTGGGVANTNGPVLSKFLQAQKDYNIEVILNPPPPPASSIQLHWWQSERDTEK